MQVPYNLGRKTTAPSVLQQIKETLPFRTVTDTHSLLKDQGIHVDKHVVLRIKQKSIDNLIL